MLHATWCWTMKFNTDIEILKKQVVVETFRSSGPGGQRKNKTETAIRLHHLPSGIRVTATEHRLQSQNLRLAFERLQKQLKQLNRPKRRRLPTPVPLKAKEKRIEDRKIRSEKKRFRKSPSFDQNHMD